MRDVSLDVRDGEFVALLGPSGCGKTTLLRAVAGLDPQSSGRILIGGRDVSNLPPRSRGLAMVFQNYAVFPHLRVRDNIAFGLVMTGATKDRIERQVARAAALMHIEMLLDRYPAQLSGGQRQRVAVARALAVEPAVLLMDEPLSNLDALLRLEMRAELKAVLAEARTTTLYVTHDQTEAMGLADRIAIMQDGRIVQMGNADGDLSASALDVRRRLHRQPADEFPAASCDGWGGAAGHAHADAAGQCTTARSHWGSGRRTWTSPTMGRALRFASRCRNRSARTCC